MHRQKTAISTAPITDNPAPGIRSQVAGHTPNPSKPEWSCSTEVITAEFTKILVNVAEPSFLVMSHHERRV
jgi:hypothetical protein